MRLAQPTNPDLVAPPSFQLSWPKMEDKLDELSPDRADEILFGVFKQALAMAFVDHDIDPTLVNIVCGGRMGGTAGLTIQRQQIKPPITFGMLTVAAAHMRALAKELLPEAMFYAGVTATTGAGATTSSGTTGSLAGTATHATKESDFKEAKRAQKTAIDSDIFILAAELEWLLAANGGVLGRASDDGGLSLGRELVG